MSLHTVVIAVALAATCALTPLRAQTPAPALPPGSGAAVLLSFTGQISVMRDSTPWALKVGDLVQPLQKIVTGPDGYGLFQVADGSKFEVFSNAQVVFRQNRGNWEDLLEIWLGKVRVQIEHPGGLPNHNRVRTPSAVISVRGTIFDVNVDDTDDTTLVLDEEGQVEVRHTLQAGNPRVLNPGEYVRVYKNEPLAKKMIDKAGALQRLFHMASDALYQAAVEARNAGSVAHTTTAPTTTTSPADTTHAPPAPPPPPAQ